MSAAQAPRPAPRPADLEEIAERTSFLGIGASRALARYALSLESRLKELEQPRLKTEWSDDYAQLDQAVMDAEALPRPQVQIDRLRAIREKYGELESRLKELERDAQTKVSLLAREVSALRSQLEALKDAPREIKDLLQTLYDKTVEEERNPNPETRTQQYEAYNAVKAAFVTSVASLRAELSELKKPVTDEEWNEAVDRLRTLAAVEATAMNYDVLSAAQTQIVEARSALDLLWERKKASL